MTLDAGDAADKSFNTLTPEAMVRINDQCDVYEKRCRGANRVSVASYLEEIDAPEGEELQVLIRELIAIDLHHRIRGGQQPKVSDYSELSIDHCDDSISEWIRQAYMEVGSEAGVLAPDQRIGDYLVLEEVGRGGMGHVYRAVHVLMNREVAIKMLTNRVRRDPVARRRFEREIRSVAKLSHRNIVTAFDARVEQDSLYLVTEWIVGSDLARLVEKEGPLPIGRVVNYAKQAARGLRYSHEQGLIHRDVKPGNLLVDNEGVLKVLDLGLAKLLFEFEDDDVAPDALTKSTHIVGTPAFLAPEQARNALTADLRCDVYSLGCTLFYLLCGKAPYRSDNRVDVILAHTEKPTPRVIDRRSDVPQVLSDLVYAMMEKEPDDRPQTMDEVLDQLIAIQPSSGNLAESTTAIEDAARSSSVLSQTRPRSGDAHPRWTRWVAPLVAAMVLIGGWLLYRNSWLASQDPQRLDSTVGEGGVWFNGKSSYACAPLFIESIDDAVMVEVLVTPQPGPTPSNVVSWTGNHSLFLFSSVGSQWGVGIWINEESRLVIAREPIVFDQSYVLAVRWDGESIELLINGRVIETEPTDYPLFPATPMLCFGGAPPGLLPEDTGTRFFTGMIHAARVSKGQLPHPAKTPKDLLQQQDSTLALFRFETSLEESARDQSNHQYQLEFTDAKWLPAELKRELEDPSEQ